MVYAKIIDGQTCQLVDQDGNNVNYDGSPAYHPIILSVPAAYSGFPLYVEKCFCNDSGAIELITRRSGREFHEIKPCPICRGESRNRIFLKPVSEAPSPVEVPKVIPYQVIQAEKNKVKM